MSWWISLEGADEGPLHSTPAHSEGGTYVLGGMTECDVNVTYNYGRHFRFPNLDGRTGQDTISELQEAVDRLGTDRSDNYWEPTEGNAGAAVKLLLNWAREHPKGTWSVS